MHDESLSLVLAATLSIRVLVHFLPQTLVHRTSISAPRAYVRTLKAHRGAACFPIFAP